MVSGLDLLVGQALLQLELMTGRTVPAEILYAAGQAGAHGFRTRGARSAGRERLSLMLRWLTAGESHGPALVAILEGLPAHVQVTSTDIGDALARRRLGFGRGARMKFEADAVTILGGVRHGETQGGPVAIQVGNTEWPKWETVMSADPCRPTSSPGRPATRRSPVRGPGTPTWPGCRSTTSTRPGRSSSGPAPARPPRGSRSVGWRATSCPRRSASPCSATWSSSAPSGAPAGLIPTFEDLPGIDDDPVRCFDRDASAAMIAEVETAQKDGDTLGGVVEVVVWGLPPGLGSHVHWDRRLDARLAGALMGIQAIKGVEVGDGFELARTRGSLAHDEITLDRRGSRRASHRSGGTEGGMSTGEVLRVRAAMKPIATVPRALRTVDTTTLQPAVAHHQRSDVCAVPAAGVVAEAMVALVVADAVIEKFGGDSVGETRRNYEAYLKHVAERGLQVHTS